MKNLFAIWKFFGWLAFTTAALSLIAANVAADSAQNDLIVVNTSPFMATFAGGTTKTTGRLKVRIAGPDGETVFESASESGLVDWAADANLSDGLYRWDAWYTPQSALQEQSWHADYKNSLDAAVQYKSGTFHIEGGVLLPRDRAMRGNEQVRIKAPIDQGNPKEDVSWTSQVAGMILDFLVPAAGAEQVFSENVRVQASGPRLIYEDTLSGAADWDTGHNSLLGGWFLRDLDASNVMFLAEAGAPDNSIFIESTGNIGVGTSSPQTDLHVVGSAGSLTLEGTSASQKWAHFISSVGGYLIQDRNTFTVPFVIRPGAPTASLDIGSNGNVGMGTSSPSAPLHVQRSDGTARVSVNEKSGSTASRTLFDLRNNGANRFVIENTDAASGAWSFAVGSDSAPFVIGKVGSGVQEAVFEGGGDLTIGGTLTEGSSRAIKDNIAKVNHETVLAKLDALSITEWSYIGDSSERHIGPMAEDFHATFGLGSDNKHLAPKDLAGVALAATKALKAENEALKAEVAKMEQIEDRLKAMEGRLAELKQ